MARMNYVELPVGDLPASADFPQKSRSVLVSTVQPRPHSYGVTVSSMSCPYRCIPASNRNGCIEASQHDAQTRAVTE